MESQYKKPEIIRQVESKLDEPDILDVESLRDIPEPPDMKEEFGEAEFPKVGIHVDEAVLPDIEQVGEPELPHVDNADEQDLEEGSEEESEIDFDHGSADSSDVEEEIAVLESLIQPVNITASLPKDNAGFDVPPPKLPVKDHPIEKSPTKPMPKNRRPLGPPLPQRNVPFRKIRKAFSRATGIHGVFTRPSPKVPARQRPVRPDSQGKKTALEEMLLSRQHQVKHQLKK